MSRLSIITQNKAQATVEELYKDLERRISASPPGLCPVDLASSFLKLCHAQSCGKCVPCRVGLGQLQKLMEQVLDGQTDLSVIDLNIFYSADCAIGYEAARMVLKGIRGFRDDFEEHILRGRCKFELNQPVPCVSQCPAGVDIPGYVALVAEGRYGDAVRLIRKDNPLPAVCGLTMVDDPVNIRGLKRFAVDHAGDVPLPVPAVATGKKVAVIGGGPGGISAAYYLTLMGHEVTIFEQRKKLGGMLRYGIPNYRLPREELDREINHLLSLGIHVKTEVTVGEDPNIADLREEYDAVYIAIGAHIDRKIGIEGEEAQGVISAVELLREIGDDEMPDFTGKEIVVIGGGNVAMDVARSAVRLGAKRVRIAYRRRRVDMTAMEEEIEGAIEEGCELLDLHAPLKIEVDENGRAAALWVQPQIIGPMKHGRPIPMVSEKAPVRLACDIVIVAIGQGIESKEFEKQGIPVKRGVIEAMSWSGVKTKDITGVFAGGDCVTGPATVIRAIAAGKVAAANIDEFLGYNHVISADVEIPRVRLDDNRSCARVNMKVRQASERIKDFELIEEGMTCEEACQEARRCIRCDHFGFGILKGGRIEKW